MDTLTSGPSAPPRSRTERLNQHLAKNNITNSSPELKSSGFEAGPSTKRQKIDNSPLDKSSKMPGAYMIPPTYPEATQIPERPAVDEFNGKFQTRRQNSYSTNGVADTARRGQLRRHDSLPGSGEEQKSDESVKRRISTNPGHDEAVSTLDTVTDTHHRSSSMKDGLPVQTTTRPQPASANSPPDVASEQFRTIKKAARSDLYADGSSDELAGPATEKRHKKSKKKKETSEKQANEQSFALHNVVCRAFVDAPGSVVHLNKKYQSVVFLWPGSSLGKTQPQMSVPLNSIDRVYSDKQKVSPIVGIKIKWLQRLNSCWLRFDGPRAATDFCDAILNTALGLKHSSQNHEWLEDALSAERRKIDAETSSIVQQQPDPAYILKDNGDSRNSHGHETKVDETRPKTRLTQVLDAPSHQGNDKVDSTIAGSQHTNGRATRNRHTQQVSSNPTAHEAVCRRSTRTNTRETAQLIDDDVPTQPKQSRRQGEPWKKPLVYPSYPEAKGTVTITWDHLARLEDGEFLNDELISLFLRYLQELRPEETKLMHFFSTFFFQRLTTDNDGRKIAGVNYDAVATWTKKHNLFTRDFVIVPVNENAHWYVMIICNTKALLEQQSAEEVDRIDVDAEDESTVDNGDKGFLNSDPADLPVAEANHVVDLDVDDTSKPSIPKKCRGKKTRSLPKYEPTEPVIITLDSLDAGRSNTAGKLKKYLCKEASSRVRVEIDPQRIQGMTAKAIPLQPNFYDCGIYLCLYLEQFMKDPNKFVKAILLRTPEVLDWPKKIKSEALRDRFYDLLMELHQEQESKHPANIPPLGDILIRSEDRAPATTSHAKEMDISDRFKKGIEESKRLLEKRLSDRRLQLDVADKVFANNVDDLLDSKGRTIRPSSAHSNGTKKPSASHSTLKHIKSKSVAHDEKDIFVIEDDSQKQEDETGETTSSYFNDQPPIISPGKSPTKSETQVRATPPKEMQPRIDTPQELAAQMKEAESQQYHPRSLTSQVQQDFQQSIPQSPPGEYAEPMQGVETDLDRQRQIDALMTDAPIIPYADDFGHVSISDDSQPLPTKRQFNGVDLPAMPARTPEQVKMDADMIPT